MAFPLTLLLPILAEVGAPLLKRVISRHASGSAGDVAGAVVDAIAGRLGTVATPEAIEQAYRADPAGAGAAIREVEIERREDWAAMIADVNATMRAEQQSGGLLQRAWRPVFGLLYGVAFLGMALTVVKAVWTGDAPAINALAAISGFLIAFYGMGASVLGVYVWQRSTEKRAGAA